MSPTPPQDDQAPATKKDIQDFTHLIMGTLLDMENRMVMKIGVEEAIEASEERMKEEIRTSIQTSERHLLVVFEDLKHDVMGIHTDKISQHEDRIVRLEEHAGLAV